MIRLKRETLIWSCVMLLGALGLIYAAMLRPSGMAKVYVRDVPVSAAAPDAGVKSLEVAPRAAGEPGVHLSIPRTVGVWFAAFLTLCVFSFLHRDNPFYKFAEAVFVGSSAAYWMIVSFWNTIINELFGKLMPALLRAWAVPSIPADEPRNWFRLVPLVLGVMLLWRLAPRGQWIGRWPLAVIIGTFAGIRLVTYIEADLVGQVSSTILPLVVFDSQNRFDFLASLTNTVMVASVLACLIYFFFSFEHKGTVGRVARLGVLVLMITFGASFAMTVMGRITLLTDRVQFLVDDWLWIIDSGDRR